MTADNVLQILPHRGLDQSILLAILIGLLILLIFTETMGWVFVGLVVPGYLSSVFVIQPSMGVAIAIEAVVTYLLVRLLSDILARSTIWSPFFGRERFFLIVLVSIVVRQNSQIWGLPMLLGWIDSTFGTDLLFDASEFSSIGLVLVPLVANMFWKINLVRGIYQIGVPVLFTYSILVFVLLPFTNLSFSNIEITYDNVALNFLNTPKAYIIMLTGAILAARFNVLYGWDYNGILVPSLLSLAWLEPMAIPITILEVLLLFGVTKLVLANPLLRTINLEGPRQVALVFLLSFLLKYILAWVMGAWWPHLNVINFFGFGYVITSLITVKMLQKKVIMRVLLPTLHVSLMAFLCGSVMGFVLEKVAPRPKLEALAVADRPVETRTLLRSPLGATAVASVRARAAPRPAHVQGHPQAIMDRYRYLWEEVDRWLATSSPAHTRAIDNMARGLGLSLHELSAGAADGRRAYAIVEREERLDRQVGWDTAVLIPGAPGPIIEVPRPLTEPASAELAAVLCEELQCRAILVSGIDSADGGRTAGDALAHPRSTFAAASNSLRSAPIVQVRVSKHVPPDTAHLHLHHKLPEMIRLDHLWPPSVAMDIELLWSAPPGPSASWARRRDQVVLFVHPDAVWQVLVAHAARVARPPAQHAGVSLKAWLRDTLGPTRSIGVTQTVPSPSEVRFIGHMLTARLLDMQPERVAWLSYLASLIDYEIVALEDCVEGARCLVLTEQRRPVLHRWGTLAVRTDVAEPLVIEAPRPLLEMGTWQVAAEMWRHTRARALLVGHDLPVTHGVPRLDPVRYGNVATPFHAMHESLHRALRRDAGAVSSAGGAGVQAPLIVQVRGFASWRQLAGHLVIGLGPPALEPRQMPPQLARMLAADGFLGWLSDDTELARGEPDHITLSGQGNPQLSFTHSTGGVDMALVWLSQPVRQLYLDEMLETASRRLEIAGFTLSPRSALTFLTAPLAPPARTATPGPGLDEVVALGMDYARTHDVAILHRLYELSSQDPRVQVSASWSTELAIPFLALSVNDRDVVGRAVILLAEIADDCADETQDLSPSREALEAALTRRCRSIILRHPRPGP